MICCNVSKLPLPAARYNGEMAVCGDGRKPRVGFVGMGDFSPEGGMQTGRSILRSWLGCKGRFMYGRMQTEKTEGRK
jgi:hypothetical protein